MTDNNLNPNGDTKREVKIIAYYATRLVLGIIFLIAGLNGFLVVFDIEPWIPTSSEAMELFQFSYLLVVEKALEVICGFLLMINRFVPLALAVLTPITANIFLFHNFVDPSLLILAVIMIIIQGYLLYHFKDTFKGLLESQ
ncbi:DoxX family membrane protein [Gracilibacillus suaedae]|uniref:DoxX family membrane protein n=1 Tax=Gracilibacillus suaedae TaxID=2820273 RepID=UPI001ABE9091|nr:DoxX family membrane protein [Gracilibacillus suaedae]